MYLTAMRKVLGSILVGGEKFIFLLGFSKGGGIIGGYEAVLGWGTRSQVLLLTNRLSRLLPLPFPGGSAVPAAWRGRGRCGQNVRTLG